MPDIRRSSTTNGGPCLQRRQTPGATRRAAAALVALLVASGLGIAVPGTAHGWYDATSSGGFGSPLTWVDDQDRQLVLGVEVPPSGPAQRFVERLLPDGTPDASWGAGGRRDLDLAPPSAGLALAGTSVDRDGAIGVAWLATPCGAGGCATTFARYQPDGTVVGAAVTAGTATSVALDLPDGSFIMRTGGGGLAWFGNDGSDRGTPVGLSEPVGQSVTVDRSGRLLFVTTGNQIVRWPAGGPASTLASVTCASGTTPALGPAVADDGFATVCSPTPNARPVVRRHNADGSVAWSAEETTAGTHLAHADQALVDGLDRVWVGGTLLQPPIDIGQGTRRIGVVPFGSAGPLGPGADLPTTDEPGRQSSASVTDLRPAGTDGVAYATIDDCCTTIEGTVPESSTVQAGRLPGPPGKPAGHAEDLAITAAGASTLDVAFGPEVLPELGREPTGYRVEATGPTGTATATTGTVAPGALLHAQLSGLVGGKAVTVTVTPFNALGDSTDPAVSDPANQASTVLPFISAAAFVGRQYQDLLGAAPPPLPQSTFDQLTDGTTDPAAFTANLLATGLAGTEVEPVARLYRAYFLRDPDRSGLTYWVAKRHGGGKLSTISDRFARSSEFTRRYGSLTNGAFVDALYRNVFGRAPDPAGLAFWTTRLNTHRNTRGQVVLQFSESTEGVRRSTPVVVPLAAAHLMLGRLPTAPERAAWLVLADTRHDVAAAILASTPYAERVATVP